MKINYLSHKYPEFITLILLFAALTSNAQYSAGKSLKNYIKTFTVGEDAGLNLAMAPAPSNDNCAGAITLTPSGSCSATAGTTVSATQSLAAITCNGFTGNADDDVWFKFTATSTSNSVSVTGSSTFDAVVDMRSGSCNGTNIYCADATFSGGTETISTTGLTIGTTYYIRVYSYSATTGTFTICVTTPM